MRSNNEEDKKQQKYITQDKTIYYNNQVTITVYTWQQILQKQQNI